RSRQSHRNGRARSKHVQDRRGSDLLLQAARNQRRAGGVDDREWILPGSIPGAADGIRARSAAAAGNHARRKRWLMPVANPSFPRTPESMLSVSECGDRTKLVGSRWIPAFAGMTRDARFPAFAGMTTRCAIHLQFRHK